MSDAVAASPKKKGATKPKKVAKPSSHPPSSAMVKAAIKNLKDRKGSSLQAIKKYIAANYKCDVVKLSPFIRKALKSGVEKGAFTQAKGVGASGSFKLSESGKKEKVVKPKKAKKPKAAKPKKAKTPKKAKAAKPKKVKTPKKAAKAAKPKSAKKAAPKPKKTKTPKKKPAAKKAKKKIPKVGLSLQTPFMEYLEKQKKKLHHKPGTNVTSENSLLSQIFEKVIIVMVFYFVISIVNSMAQSYHKRLSKEKGIKSGKLGD